jgi:hypothetical protein
VDRWPCASKKLPVSVFEELALEKGESEDDQDEEQPIRAVLSFFFFLT